MEPASQLQRERDSVQGTAPPIDAAPAHLVRRRQWSGLAIIGGGLLALMVVLGVFGPMVYPQDPYKQQLIARNLPPMSVDRQGTQHFLGTDPLGRDMTARLLLGIRVSLMVGFASALLAAVIGVTAGLAAGYFRGPVDAFVMRLVDIQMSFPFILVAMIWALFVGTGVASIVFIVALRGWVSFARLVRSRVLSVREAVFVEAARSIGNSTSRIVIRHVLPQTIPTILIITALEIGIAILFESTLGFLGLGIQPPTPTLGNMLADGRDYLQSAWWVVVVPGVTLSMIVVAVNLFADGLRDMLDPVR
jgi:peptide/nickel transport system permease protein